MDISVHVHPPSRSSPPPPALPRNIVYQFVIKFAASPNVRSLRSFINLTGCPTGFASRQDDSGTLLRRSCIARTWDRSMPRMTSVASLSHRFCRTGPRETAGSECTSEIAAANASAVLLFARDGFAGTIKCLFYVCTFAIHSSIYREIL